MEEDLQSFCQHSGTEGDSCRVTAINENQNHPERSIVPETAPVCIPTTLGVPCPMEVKKKERGRSRLNGQDGAHFTPHILTIEAGEDVSKTIISFSQQGEESRGICILAASGLISNVALLQPNSSGGTLTYEGQFEILSLNGSFTPMDDGVTKGRSGGMSVSLSDPNGQILGGGVAGYLMAAGPVQVVIASFPINRQLEQEMKQNNHSAENGTGESIVISPAPINHCVPISSSADMNIT